MSDLSKSSKRLAVSLSNDSPWRDLPVHLIEAEFMGSTPDRRKGEAAAFGTWVLRGGEKKTGWLMVPNLAAYSTVAREKYVTELQRANPPLADHKMEGMQLEWLSWESAEKRRQDKYMRETMRLPSEGQVQPIAPPQQQPPKLRDEDIFIGEWCARALFPALPSRTPCSASCP